MFIIIQPAKKNKLSVIRVLVYFEKAFESFSIELIPTVLSIFGFGPFFKSWIKIKHTARKYP